MIAVLVPALNRPERVGPLAESLRSASAATVSLLYLLSPQDHKTARACKIHDVEFAVTPFPLAGGDYARKINLGVSITSEPWVLQAGDDLLFHDGWDLELLAFSERRPDIRVIGTNDLGNPAVTRGMHATHSLIARDYIVEYGTVDEPGKALHEGYWHCWVDNELVETAKARKAFHVCRTSRVEHLHHIWRKGRDDNTYRRGQQRYREDNELFKSRRPLWRGRGALVHHG